MFPNFSFSLVQQQALWLFFQIQCKTWLKCEFLQTPGTPRTLGRVRVLDVNSCRSGWVLQPVQDMVVWPRGELAEVVNSHKKSGFEQRRVATKTRNSKERIKIAGAKWVTKGDVTVMLEDWVVGPAATALICQIWSAFGQTTVRLFHPLVSNNVAWSTSTPRVPPSCWINPFAGKNVPNSIIPLHKRSCII